MKVNIIYTTSDELEAVIQAEKDAGRRILAVSPAEWKRTGGKYVVIKYMVATQ